MKNKQRDIRLFKHPPKMKTEPRRHHRIGLGEAIVDVALIGAAVSIIKGSK